MTADVLSEVLSAVRLTGSVFFDVTAASPWVAEAPPSAQIADAVMPGAQHAIEYHVLTRGSAWITIVDGAHLRRAERRGASQAEGRERPAVQAPHGRGRCRRCEGCATDVRVLHLRRAPVQPAD